MLMKMNHHHYKLCQISIYHRKNQFQKDLNSSSLAQFVMVGNLLMEKKAGFSVMHANPMLIGLPVRALGHRMAQCLPKKNQPKTVNKIRPNREELAKDCFTVGFPWIMEHLGELSAAGWTRPELFRRAKHRWCTGNWGVAWLSIWRRPDLVIEIKPAGSVLFTFPSGGRIVTQSAYPEKKISIPQQTHS